MLICCSCLQQLLLLLLLSSAALVAKHIWLPSGACSDRNSVYRGCFSTMAASTGVSTNTCLSCCSCCVCHLIAQVSADQEEAEKVKVVVGAEEKDVKSMQQQTQAIADAAQAELAEAMPAFQAAIDSLKALNKNDIVEIKSFPKPPPLVQMTMEAVCILKQEKPDWDTVRTAYEAALQAL
eukprot:GHRQ01019317.1.p1 GENE.GHRQ01019317.1~~GHRQ01019317.1.p1  ORF type:complete len:180 (+),score=52.36 GHRQ01019317.1:625-1164(+)